MRDDQTVLLEIVKRWDVSEKPELRGFRCANCQAYSMADGAWHHLLTSGNFLNPVHFCDVCEEQFQKKSIEFVQPETSINRVTFGKGYPFSNDVQKTFKRLIKDWGEAYKTITKRHVICDLCKENVPHTAVGQPEAYHVWWNNDGTLVELHFDKTCGEQLGI